MNRGKVAGADAAALERLGLYTEDFCSNIYFIGFCRLLRAFVSVVFVFCIFFLLNVYIIT